MSLSEMLQTEAQPSVITYWLLKLMLLCDVSATSYQDYKGKPHHPIKIAMMMVVMMIMAIQMCGGPSGEAGRLI